jgi:RNA methyltransferase, TrmH family
MPNPETITSAANPLLKEVRRALERGELVPGGYCVAETFHLLEEALRSERPIRLVLASESAAPQVDDIVRRRRGLRVVTVPGAVLERVSATETSQGVLALVEAPVWNLDRVLAGAGPVVLLDGVQDPGNAGTIVRAAEAFGASGVVFLKGAVGPFNSKTLRASAGSLFRVPFVAGVEAPAVVEALGRAGVELYASVPAGGGAPAASRADLGGRCALAIGSEARGVGAALRAAAREVTLPTVGVESLNAAVAAAVLLYEAFRQRVP